ncbi:hypothetical protein [Streptomyces sp. NBC_01353]|uniref:hypothetical protein n=1 Tax=Streptomyces sp. NBC_01353 TaxID=2903835 RepID=UPI002E2F77C2|nr:hypothetical protein [Streptomyces sp. NBC_01353]
MSPITDFNPGARNDARRDPRYAAVLEQVRKMSWPAGNPMLPGGWADTLATDVMAAVRKEEGQHRLITHHAYEGPGECRAQYYGLGGCGYPESEHAPAEAPTAPAPPMPPCAAREDSLAATSLTLDGPLYVLEGPADPTVEIQGPGGQPLVTIHTETGVIDYGPGYTPDAAAAAFWDALSRLGQSLSAGLDRLPAPSPDGY